MRVWFTADLHLGHGNIIKYCKRPFMTAEERTLVEEDPRGKFRLSAETVERHDEALLDAINTRVDKQDILWILGDFCMGHRNEAMKYRHRILCNNVFLIWGNHDHRSVAPAFNATYDNYMEQVEGQDIWLYHYPLRSWNRRFHGSWHLYGHVHGKLHREDQANGSWLTRDVGVDACDYRPVSFEDLKAYMEPRLEKFRQNREAAMRGEDEIA